MNVDNECLEGLSQLRLRSGLEQHSGINGLIQSMRSLNRDHVHVHTVQRVGLSLAPGVALYFTACSCTFVAVLLEQGPFLESTNSARANP